jgi:glycosyltransferase involved in cell wall biosynthesis
VRTVNSTPISPIRILHIFGTMNRGGAEMRTLELMRHIDRNQFRFEFCCLSGNPGVLDDEIRSLGGQVHLLKWSRGFTRRFRQLLRQRRIDVVHSHVHHFSGYIMRIAAGEHIRVRIAHFRSPLDEKRYTLARYVYAGIMKRWIRRNATNIVAVSEDAMSRGWSPNWRGDRRCQVIYNGLDFSPSDRAECRQALWEELHLKAGERVCINVGRVSPLQKNHGRLIEIYSALSQKCDNSCLLLVGEHPSEFCAELEKIARDTNCQGRLIFMGLRSDVPRLLSAADLMIYPTLFEGLPGVVLEACAAGLPVLASEIPPMGEIARHLSGITQVALSAKNEVWAERAAMMLQSQDGRRSPELTANEFTNSPFCVEKAVKSVVRLYQSGEKTALSGLVLPANEPVLK